MAPLSAWSVHRSPAACDHDRHCAGNTSVSAEYITLSTGTEQRAMQDGPSARDRRALHWLRKERNVENRPRLVGP